MQGANDKLYWIEGLSNRHTVKCNKKKKGCVKTLFTTTSFQFLPADMEPGNPVKRVCNPVLQQTVYIGLFIIRMEFFRNNNL